MASILHGKAKTTPRIRKEIQESEESIAALAKKNITLISKPFSTGNTQIRLKTKSPAPNPPQRVDRAGAAGNMHRPATPAAVIGRAVYHLQAQYSEAQPLQSAPLPAILRIVAPTQG